MISLVIPTHNRADLLERALYNATALQEPQDNFEIIVVDNASTDKTRQLVQGLQKNQPRSTLNYVYEARLGLHNARHAGARMAKGDILVFTDDDATFDPGWLQAYSDAFDAYPEMGAAGGPVRPVYASSPPQWILDYVGMNNVCPILSLMEPYPEFRLDQKGYFFGVNMAIRRDVLFEVGGFNPEIFGHIWLGDGESGLNRKLWNRGMLVGYVPDAIVYHHIPSERMTVDYFRRRMANEGACDVYTHFHHRRPGFFNLCKHAAVICLENSKVWLAAHRLRGRTDRRAIAMQTEAARAYSQLRYVIRLMFDKELHALILKDDWLNEL